MPNLQKSGIPKLLELFEILTGLYLECFTILSTVRPFSFKPMVLKFSHMVPERATPTF
jgi:hypothetical protein